MKENDIHIEFDGHCPICSAGVRFSSKFSWYRDWLICSQCGSIPRERAFALVLDELRPNWRKQRIHESSPGNRGISPKMKRECPGYVASQFHPDEALGDISRGYQNQNLEQMTFADGSFDIFASLDVMEHVNAPDKVFQETARTLVTGGLCLFTTPTYKALPKTIRRALYNPDGSIDNLGNEPEYHGNPISDAGSLVTHHFGYDLPNLIEEWSGMSTRVYRFHDQEHGILGEFTELYACTKWR